ncbi:phosphoglycerate kinase [Planctomycetaceae bacterium SCGC AG-212-F19]|nr:phosphoglycerate kinase [Planctomycetaceae bacterium SCGC AG-212-F19]
MKKTIADLTDLRGKRVLVRVDFNVPQDAEGNITNDRRIRAAVPTLKQLLNAGAAVIVMSHLGRPKGDPKKDAPYKMDQVAERLSELLLPHKIVKVDEVIGPQVDAAVDYLQPGDVLLLENLRFHPGEQKGDPAFAKELAKLADVYVNDAFGTCHRADASMVAVPQAMKGKPRVVGLLVAKELEILGQLLSAPPRPVVGILGGAKVSDKIGFIKALLSRVDRVLIGGAMTYTFMRAKDMGIGSSRVEADKIDVARDLLRLGGAKVVLPEDHLVVQDITKPGGAKVVTGAIPDGWVGVDIGPKTIARYAQEIAKAGTAVWNGPMGKFEDEPYSKGTRVVAEAMAAAKGVTIVGGGETAEAVEEFGLAEKMTHVSTGGGAFLEYVEGTPFAALVEIDEKSP